MIWEYLNGILKKIRKTGQFREKPDPGQFWSGKKLSAKNFWSFVDFKNEVFGKPDSGQKNRIRASGRHYWHGGSWKWINLRVPIWWVEENLEKLPFYSKTGNRTKCVRENICIQNFLFKCRFQIYFYIFNIQSQSKDMKQMAQVSHKNWVAVKMEQKMFAPSKRDRKFIWIMNVSNRISKKLSSKIYYIKSTWCFL